jgi:biopolymer transport protein ExbD
MATATHFEIIDRLLAPVTESLTAEAARALVDLRAAPDVQARIDELAGKANEGELDADEAAEYQAIVEVIDLISLLQAKARARLAREP